MRRQRQISLHDIAGLSVSGAIVKPEVQNLDSAEAVLAACEDADAVVACVGDFLGQTGEFRDRADLSLSGDQQALLELVKSTGKPLVVVLVSRQAAHRAVGRRKTPTR